MIYGNYAKQYANNMGGGNYKVISESEAILEYMTNEAEQYKNIMINESYMDDNERLVIEAKYEVLQEAVTGAIIAAIIAIITAIIALIGAFITMLSKGASAINNSGGKQSNTTTSNSKQQNSNVNKDNNSNDRKKEAIEYYNKLYIEYKNQLKNDFENGKLKNDHSSFLSDELDRYLRKDLSKSEFGTMKSGHGITDFDLSNLIDATAFKKSAIVIKDMKESFKKYHYYNNEFSRECDKWIKELKEIMGGLINFGDKASIILHNDSYDLTIKILDGKLTSLFSEKSNERKDIEVYNCVYYFKKNKVNENTTKVQKNMESDLKELKEQLKELDRVDIPVVDRMSSNKGFHEQTRNMCIDSLRTLQNIAKISESFMKSWANIENYRMRGIKFLKDSFYKNYDIAAKSAAWERTSIDYKDVFDMEHPDPAERANINRIKREYQFN